MSAEQIAIQLDRLVSVYGDEDPVSFYYDDIVAAIAQILKQAKSIKKLEALLADCAEFIEPYSDVSDGAYGEPVPNAAMSLLSAINEEIA